MKERSLLKIIILAAVFALVGPVQAKGPGGGGQGNAQGQMKRQAPASAQGQGDSVRSQRRDPATNPTGQPIQQRDRVHTPTAPAAAPASN